MSRHPIRFGIQTGQQNVAWEQVRDFWRQADDWGYDSLWCFDHFYPIFVPDPSGTCLESWTMLGALSQVTRRARIGALVNGNTYRNPCVLAKMAATLDQMSGGRLNLGIGSGWFELEHESFGVDFKTVGGRLQALDETCQIVRGMFTQEKTTLRGRHYNVVDAICSPKPLQKPHPPIMIGGRGERTLLKLVAKHADIWNLSGGPAEQAAQLIEVIRRHGDSVKRDTEQIEKSVLMALCYRAPKEREQAVLNLVAAMGQTAPDRTRASCMVGSKDECLGTVERYAKAGVTHFIFMAMAPYFVEDFQHFAEDVIPAAKR